MRAETPTATATQQRLEPLPRRKKQCQEEDRLMSDIATRGGGSSPLHFKLKSWRCWLPPRSRTGRPTLVSIERGDGEAAPVSLDNIPERMLQHAIQIPGAECRVSTSSRTATTLPRSAASEQNRTEQNRTEQNRTLYFDREVSVHIYKYIHIQNSYASSNRTLCIN